MSFDHKSEHKQKFHGECMSQPIYTASKKRFSLSYSAIRLSHINMSLARISKLFWWWNELSVLLREVTHNTIQEEIEWKRDVMKPQRTELKAKAIATTVARWSKARQVALWIPLENCELIGGGIETKTKEHRSSLISWLKLMAWRVHPR